MIVAFLNQKGGVGEHDALADGAGEYRRIVIGQRLGGLASDDGARGAAIENEAGDELRPVDARFRKERQHLGRGPAVERRRLHGDQREIGGE